MIIDTGSTNRAGMRITVDDRGRATVEVARSEPKQVSLDEPVCRQFLKHLKAALPMESLPRQHCAKSISFGSSLFVEYEGHRSPDLSCPGEAGPSAALKKDANEILRAARKAVGLPAEGPLRRIER